MEVLNGGCSLYPPKCKSTHATIKTMEGVWEYWLPPYLSVCRKGHSEKDSIRAYCIHISTSRHARMNTMEGMWEYWLPTYLSICRKEHSEKDSIRTYCIHISTSRHARIKTMEGMWYYWLPPHLPICGKGDSEKDSIRTYCTHISTKRDAKKLKSGVKPPWYFSQIASHFKKIEPDLVTRRVTIATRHRNPPMNAGP
jgi:hypothetical protein